jgi:hypothetical protein
MQDTSKPQKKAWATPEFSILSTNNVENKSHPNVREATGTQSGGSFSTPAHINWFIGTKNQAIS